MTDSNSVLYRTLGLGFFLVCLLSCASESDSRYYEYDGGDYDDRRDDDDSGGFGDGNGLEIDPFDKEWDVVFPSPEPNSDDRDENDGADVPPEWGSSRQRFGSPSRGVPSSEDSPSSSPSQTRSPRVDRYIKGLRKARTATAAFWKLVEVPDDVIPELIPLVESEEPTALERLKILVLQRNYVRHNRLFLVSDIPGMGLMETFDDEGNVVSKSYTKKSIGVPPNKRGYKVVLDDLRGFPLGVVMRAALLNRFRSPKFPSNVDHRHVPLRWWRAYYRNVFGEETE